MLLTVQIDFGWQFEKINSQKKVVHLNVVHWLELWTFFIYASFLFWKSDMSPLHSVLKFKPAKRHENT